MPTKRKRTEKELIDDMAEWPNEWSISKPTVALGRSLVAEFAPFVAHLAESGLAPITIQRHMDNLWALGDKIVRDAELHQEVGKTLPRDLLEDAIVGGEGPLLAYSSNDVDEAAQKEFERMTRKLAKFRGMEVW
jgi:ABC-type sugar transport system ATPase subunit